MSRSSRPFRSFGHRLPYPIARRLFGDRRQFGLTPQLEDPDWRVWNREVYLRFYQGTQKQSVGRIINDSGYRVLSHTTMSGRRVLEIGPGQLPHLRFWRDRPAQYVVADIQQVMLDLSAQRLREAGVQYSTVLLPLETLPRLPFTDGEFDLILSFYSLEHLYPLSAYLSEIRRCLKPGGLLVGAIPAEGGLAWGLGRFVTSRRWLLRNSTVDPDKIICWEHPNFAAEILNQLNHWFSIEHLAYYPWRLPSLDLNLVVRFRCRRESLPP